MRFGSCGIPRERATKPLGLLADHGVQIMRVPHPHCPLGALWITLYRSDADAINPADAWPLYLLSVADDNRLPQTRLTSGTHKVPSGAAPEKEDAQLFNQALASGLLQSESNGRLTIAPADLQRLQQLPPQHHVGEARLLHWQGISGMRTQLKPTKRSTTTLPGATFGNNWSAITRSACLAA